MEKININGILIYPFKSEIEILEYIDHNKGILVAVNSKKIKEANESLRAIVNNNIGYVDGAGAQIALKHKGIKNPCKIPGCELWLRIIQQFYKSKTIYIVGGSEEVITLTIQQLKNQYPDIKIIGYRNGYMSSAEELSLLEDIRVKKPDIVFVAMGSPKQEYLMRKMYEVNPAIYQGLGGSLDVYVGRVRRAPHWFSEHNLEGVYRAFFEPRKRLKGVITDIKFLLDLKRGKY